MITSLQWKILFQAHVTMARVKGALGNQHFFPRNSFIHRHMNRQTEFQYLKWKKLQLLLGESIEDPRYNDSICPPRFCRSKEFAAIKNPIMHKYDKW